MKKKIIIISSIIVCLLIVGGITFFALNKTSKDKTLDVTENLEAETSTHMLKRNLMFLLIRKKLIQKKETSTVEADKKEDEKRLTIKRPKRRLTTKRPKSRKRKIYGQFGV